MTISDSSGDDRSSHAPVGKPDGLAAEHAARGVRISRTTVNFMVDTVLLLLVMLLLFTAAVLRFVFPAPSVSGGWTLWSYDYDAWAAFQFVLASIIGLAILLHVMLHWSWVCGVVLSRILGRNGRAARLDDGQQTLWGVGMLIAVVNILGLLVGLAYLMVQAPAISLNLAPSVALSRTTGSAGWAAFPPASES